MASCDEEEALTAEVITTEDAHPREENEKVVFEDSSTESESESALLHSQKPNESTRVIPVGYIFALSAVAFAIDFGYAASDALLVPLLVGSGLRLSYASLVVAASPALGAFFQPFLGSLSDECTCSWGRRRPFILFLCLVMSAGFLLAPFAPLVSELQFENSQVMGITLTVLAVLILDFGLAQSQSPSRAYLLDVVPTSQLQTGNFIYTMYSGVGMCLGFVVAAIDWSKITGREVTVINRAQLVFGIVAILTLATMFVTVSSVRETPRNRSDSERGFGVWKWVKDTCLFVSLMSKDMWMLWFASFFGFIAVWTFLFFSTFVGEVIYGGNGSASTSTEDYQLYAEGVQIASWGLAIGGGISALFSLFMDKLANKIGLKLLFLVVQYVFVIACFFLTIVRNVWVVFILAVAYGPYLVIYLTVPFTIIPAYHESGKLLRQPWPSGDNIIGKACAVMYTNLFAGQVIAGLLCGPISASLESSSATMMIACVAASISFALTMSVEIPSNKK